MTVYQIVSPLAERAVKQYKMASPWSWILYFEAVKNLESMCGAKKKNGIAKQSTQMKCLQKIEQNWSLKCENQSIIGDLMRDPAK